MDGSSGAGYPSHSNVTIEGNVIYNAGIHGGQGDGIDIKGGIRNLTVRANEIYSLGSSGVRAIVMQGQQPGVSQTTVIERNRIHDCAGVEDGAIAIVLHPGRQRDQRNGLQHSFGRGNDTRRSRFGDGDGDADR